MPSITREEVAHLARLARIELSDEELDHLAPQLDQIIALVGQVSQVAADDIPPTSHALPLTNVMRADVNVPCLTPEQALSGAPAQEEQRFRCCRRGDFGSRRIGSKRPTFGAVVDDMDDRRGGGAGASQQVADLVKRRPDAGEGEHAVDIFVLRIDDDDRSVTQTRRRDADAGNLQER